MIAFRKAPLFSSPPFTLHPVMNMRPFLITLSALALSVPTLVHAADADADGMDDAWEISMGLSSTNPRDAFGDKDGDRVPNLWEYVRGTNANLASSSPSFDATVDPRLNPDGSQNTSSTFATMQQAQDALVLAPSHDPEGRYLVQLLRGIHRNASLRRTMVNGNPGPLIKIAWLGQRGGARNTGEEGTILTGHDGYGDEIPTGLEINDEAYLDGIIIDGDYTNVYAPAIRTMPAPELSGTVPEVWICNSIIRHWNPYIDLASGNDSIGGICNDGADVSLVHCTIWNSHPTIDAGNGSWVPGVEFEARSGVSRLINSILWTADETALLSLTGTGTVMATSTISKGGGSGTITSDPLLTVAGYPRSTSTSVLNAATALDGWVSSDLHNQVRPATTVERGAVEWVSVDGDTLPDWWELFWFGNTAQTATGDPNSDGWSNLNSYFNDVEPSSDQDADFLPDDWERYQIYYRNYQANSGTQPLPMTLDILTTEGNPDLDGRTNLQEYQTSHDPFKMDADWDGDGDGLYDIWELTYWSSITTQNGMGNPDRDGRNNWQEQASGTDPLSVDWDMDLDGDGLHDLWELSYWPSIATQDATGNPDNDGRNNLQEQASYTDPTEIDWDWDGDADGLMDYWELIYWPSITNQNGSENPDGDARTNLQEFIAGTDPTLPDYDWDSDSDGLMDGWELANFGDISSQNGAGNPDGDTRTNLQEQQTGNNPNAMDPDTDLDADGLIDLWEVLHFGNTAAQGASGNPDGDGRTNIEEQATEHDPNVVDSDWDGDADNMPDVWEVAHLGGTAASPGGDLDGDGLSNFAEFKMGLLPEQPDANWLSIDTDFDGLPNGREWMFVGSLNQSGLMDLDGDGLINAIEFNWTQTLPNNSDSDGDGIGDSLEVQMLSADDSDGDGLTDSVDWLPFDPNAGQTSQLIQVSGPPVVSLVNPPGAVLVP